MRNAEEHSAPCQSVALCLQPSTFRIHHSAFRMHRPYYLAVFWMFARNSLIRDMTFRTNYIIEVIFGLSLGADEPGVLHAHLPADVRRRRRPRRHRRLVAVRVLRLHRHDDSGEQLRRRLLHGERRGTQRTDAHRRARLRAAQADRHAVSRLAAADQLVGRPEAAARARAACLLDAADRGAARSARFSSCSTRSTSSWGRSSSTA